MRQTQDSEITDTYKPRMAVAGKKEKKQSINKYIHARHTNAASEIMKNIN